MTDGPGEIRGFFVGLVLRTTLRSAPAGGACGHVARTCSAETASERRRSEKSSSVVEQRARTRLSQVRILPFRPARLKTEIRNREFGGSVDRELPPAVGSAQAENAAGNIEVLEARWIPPRHIGRNFAGRACGAG